MAADGHEVGPQLLGREGNLEKALDGVHMEQSGGAGGADGIGRGPDRENGAHFIVHQHHGHQNGVRPDGLSHRLGIDAACPVRLAPGDLKAFALEGFDRLQHRGVLDGGGDDVVSLPAVQFHGGGNGPVVSLGAAGGEEELLRQTAQRPRDHRPVGVPALGRRLSQRVAGGGVAIALGHHLIGGPGGSAAHRGGGGMIQIDGHGGHLLVIKVPLVL